MSNNNDNINDDNNNNDNANNTEEPQPTETEKQIAGLLGTIHTMATQVKALAGQVKDLHKQLRKDLKHAQKQSGKQKVKKLRKLSGFAKPCPVSSALCVFIGQPVGTDMARTEVTKFLTRYIKEHDLQDKDDRRKIVPDKKLGKLLGSKKSDVVTYFNLQSYLKQHFPKAAAVAK
jgi:chromatin remodeling complex protein RSC6